MRLLLHVHTMRVESFGVVWAAAGQVAHFMADEALGVRVLPLRNFGLALLRCVGGSSALEADSRSRCLWLGALTQDMSRLTTVEANL